MKKALLIILIIGIIIVGGFFFYQNLKKEKASSLEEISMPETINNPEGKPSVSYGAGKKIAMVIAFRDFRDAEYFVPKEILEKAGAEITTVSTRRGTAIGADGGEVEVDLLISETNPAEFDAVLFIGGPGCLENLDNETSYQLVREVVSQNKVLAAICISPVILARAGVLEGKRATVWSSPMDKAPVRILEESGAIYQEKLVAVDGKIVTANGPGAAEGFARAVVQALKK